MNAPFNMQIRLSLCSLWSDEIFRATIAIDLPISSLGKAGIRSDIITKKIFAYTISETGEIS